MRQNTVRNDWKHVLQSIVHVATEVLHHDFPGSRLCAVFSHGKGVCLALKYVTSSGSAADVLVDVIPVKLVDERFVHHTVQDKFQRLIRKYCHNGEIDATGYEIAVTQKSLETYYDTGLMENQVLRALPEKLKIPLRVVKYLLQTHLALTKLCVDPDTSDVFATLRSSDVWNAL